MNVATARNFVLRMGVASLVTAAVAMGMSSRAEAQGVTTGAVRGHILDTSGQPIQGAAVMLTGTRTGNRYQTTTGEGGRYFLTNITVGEYSIEARAVGFRPERRGGVIVSLGQVAELDMRLTAATIELAAITSTVSNPLDPMSATRTGAASLVTEEAVRNLPSLNRNFTDFIATIPQVIGDVGSGGPSVGGQNNRFNNIQIDGSVNNDLFGLAASGTPGGQSGARPISVEAIREFQVLIAPFDVRQGGFTGGLVNAVTRSGTNTWHGSAFGFLQNQSLVGKDSLGNKISDFSQSQYGFTLGGPIIRDRLHFFTAVDLQSKNTPFGGLVIGSDTTGGKDSTGIGIRYPTVTRIAQIVRDSSGAWGHAFDPGNQGAPPQQTPATNIFAKLSYQPAANNTIELSFNHIDGSDDKLTHSSTATGFRDGYQLSSAGYQQANVTNTFRAIWTRAFSSRLNNELILAYQKIADHRELPAQAPLMFVGGDRNFTGAIPTTNVAVGAERFSHDNSLDQKIFEFTDNLTWSLNRVHTITIGTHNELFNFHNVFWPAKLGVWAFRDTTALLARAPYRYEIAMAGANGIGPIADFGVNQLGGYVQDQITPNSRLTINLGLRLDVPIIDRPNYNIRVDTATIAAGPRTGQMFGVQTNNFPAHNALWSPRAGFNYDLMGNGSTILRGGVGIFSGRPPYVWVSNAFVNTGLEQVTLICDGAVSSTSGTLDTVPVFTADPNNQPTACLGSPTAGSSASSIVYFDNNYKLPQNARAALGIDHRLPWNMVGTVDFVYTRWLNAIYLEDVNLVAGGISTGEGNRQLYGTPGTATSSSQTPLRLSSQFRDVIKQSNSNQDYQYQVTFQLQKRFSNGLEFNGGFTHSRTRDLMSMTSSISNSNLRFAVLDGTLSNRNLRPSSFDVPNHVTFNVTGDLPFGFRGTMFYVGRSGTPYAYVTSNDVNADGLSGNDLVYVPANAQDIQLCPLSGACTSTAQDAAAYANLDAYINAEPCLRESRGQLLQRGACRNPWQSFVNARLAKTIRTVRGQSIELTADVFNLLSLLGVGGQVHTTSFFENTNLLSLSRYNPALKRGVYNMATSLSNLKRLDTVASRWRMLLGARYSF